MPDRAAVGRAPTREFVADGSYFHPFGVDGWPKDPPNFLAFRWANQVQRIHRVTGSEVIPNLAARWPDSPLDADTERPHVAYELGPVLPGAPIPSGFNYRASRLLVLLDQLLVGPTLQDALTNTNALLART